MFIAYLCVTPVSLIYPFHLSSFFFFNLNIGKLLINNLLLQDINTRVSIFKNNVTLLDENTEHSENKMFNGLFKLFNNYYFSSLLEKIYRDLVLFLKMDFFGNATF